MPPGLLEPRIRCGAFKGKTKGDFYDRRDCEGPIAKQIEEAYQFVVKNMRVGTKIVNSQRQEVYELPLSAVREAICNAVFHRDYLEPSNVFVAFYDDRLEITSPGGLVKDFTIEQATSGISKIRNKGLAPALEYMKDVEGWGGGVSRYFEKCEELGLQPPKVEEMDGGFFRVTFYRGIVEGGAALKVKDGVREDNREDNEDNREDNEDKSGLVLASIAHDPRLTVRQLASNLPISKATVERTLRSLQKSGRLRRVGGTRGYWEILN